MSKRDSVSILGSTGSIGKQTLSVIKEQKDKWTDYNWLTIGGYSKAKIFFIELEKNKHFNILKLV